MTTKELIQTVTSITQANMEVVQSRIKKLSEHQLAWKPNPGVWSVQQVLAHLNVYGSYYHPTFLRKIENTRFTSNKEAFMSSPLGRSAWRSMKLGNAKNVKRKFKTPKSYNPLLEKSLVDGHEISRFLEQQQELLGIIEKAENVSLRRVKIPISISKIIRLRLGDALLFVVYHNERHMQQILNVCNNTNFPKA